MESLHQNKTNDLLVVPFRTRRFSTCSYGNPSARSNASSAGRPSAKRTSWTSTCGFMGGKGTALWLVTSATRASSTAVLSRATWSSTWIRKHIPAFSVLSPLTAWICLKIMWPSTSAMAISPALPAKNAFRISSRWDAVLIWSAVSHKRSDYQAFSTVLVWHCLSDHSLKVKGSTSVKLKRKGDQALLGVGSRHWRALSTPSDVVLQSGIRKLWEGWSPKVPTTSGQCRSMAQKGIVFCSMPLELEYTLSSVVKTPNQDKLVSRL